MIKRRLILAFFIILAIAGISRTGHADQLINGAGATFPYPIYSKWFDVYAKENPGIKFNYQSIGSGGGIRMLSNRTVDVGASDAPMTNQQLGDASGKILHFPSVMGAVVVAYNLPGFTGTLRLTGPVIADIFSAKITKWDDDKIRALNPSAAIPTGQDIVVCHRSDGSGTSYIFTDYLSKVSSSWSSDPGKGTAVKWPTGLGGKGNEGVTALVQQTPGAIGYVELIYALNNKIPYAQLQNKSGNWVDASLAGVTAAAASAGDMPADFRVSITDASGPDVYPISSFTWLLVYQKQSNKEVGEQIKKFLSWALTEGQTYAPDLKYAPLPPAVVQKETAQIQQIQIP
jgi:phosphate transport system substrate-binding protein